MATYYIAPTGNDGSGNGSIGAPWLKLQTALEAASPNDTIYVRGGTYVYPVAGSNYVYLGASGTANNRIKIWAYPGETPIFDCSAQTNGYNGIVLDGASYLHLKGLQIYASANDGFKINAPGAHNIIEQCVASYCGRLVGHGSAGFNGQDSSNNAILNCDAHHNKGDGIHFGVDGSESGNVVSGCRMWTNADDGLDLWDSGPVVVTGNWAWYNGYNDAFVYQGQGGSGFKLGGADPPNGGHTVTENVAWHNYLNGFTSNGASVAGRLYNNTAWDNDEATSYNYTVNEAVAWVVRNNLNFDGNTNFNAAVVHNHNSWDSSPAVTVTSDDFQSTDFSRAAIPRQPDGSLPNLSFLHLVATSDLIDVGVNVGLTFYGSAPDLGAYQTNPQQGGNMPLANASLLEIKRELHRLGYQGATLRDELTVADADAVTKAASLVTTTASLATANALKISVAGTLQTLMDTTPTLPNLRTGVDAAIAALLA